MYIGRSLWAVKHRTLINDILYIKQNGGRVARALFEIAVKVGYSNLACEALKLCKVIECQVWHHETPLRQFQMMRPEWSMKVERAQLKLWQLVEEPTAGLGRMLRDQRNAGFIKKLANSIPRFALNCTGW